MDVNNAPGWCLSYVLGSKNSRWLFISKIYTLWFQHFSHGFNSFSISSYWIGYHRSKLIASSLLREELINFQRWINPNLCGLLRWAPPIPPLINPKFIIKLVHFSMESENATNLWLIGTFPSLFQCKIKFSQPYQNCELSRHFASFRVATLFHQVKFRGRPHKNGHKKTIIIKTSTIA